MRVLLLFLPLIIGCDRYCEGGVVRNGLNITYFKNKNKKSEVEIKNCLCSGRAIFYYPDGHVYSRGQCIDAKDNGIWNFYDGNGSMVAKARWDMGEPISYTIFLKNNDSIQFDNRTKRLYSNQGNQIINSPAFEVFNRYTETELLNESLIAIRDYRDLIILTSNLEVKFRLRDINDTQFLKTYEIRDINFELDDKLLRNGVDYQIKGDSIKILVYYNNTANDIQIMVKKF